MTVAVGVRRQNQVVLAVNTGSGMGDDEYYAHGNLVGPRYQRIGEAEITWAGTGVFGEVFEWFATTRRGNVPVRTRLDVFQLFLSLWKFAKDQAHLVEDRADEQDQEPFASIYNSFLVASPGGLYLVSDNLAVTEFERYCAIGSGAPYALGALDVLSADASADAEAVASRAVQAAQRFDPRSGGGVEVRRIALAGRE